MKIAVAVVLSILSVSAFAQTGNPFIINGTIKNFKGPVEKVLITYRSNGVGVIDSVVPKNGTYTFKGNIAEPVIAQLAAKPVSTADNPKSIERKDIAAIFISPSSMQVSSTDSFSNIVVKGSPAHDEYKKMQLILKPAEEKGMELSKKYRGLDKAQYEANQEKIMAEFKAVTNERRNLLKSYVEQNPASPIAVYALNQYAGYDINADEVDPLFNNLPASAKKYPSYKDLEDRLTIARSMGIGKPAKDFTQNDTLGNPVSLSSFKGKYVLVDFWASWCGPCRQENPNVVTAFNKYKDKDFTVLGVSLDQPGKQENWLKAIHDDNLTWTHVSDLKFWNNDAAKLYGVRAIPFNVLVDKEGKIVAKNIRGEELQNKLAEIIH
jgi:peroxiredoxin